MVKGKPKTVTESTDVSKYMEEVKEIPESRRSKAKGKYYAIIDSIAKSDQKRKVKILLSAIDETLKMRSAYPSFGKALKEIARRNNVDFSTTKSRKVTTKRGDLEYVSYPEFDAWKEKNMRIKVSGQDIFIVKYTDKVL